MRFKHIPQSFRGERGKSPESRLLMGVMNSGLAPKQRSRNDKGM